MIRSASFVLLCLVLFTLVASAQAELHRTGFIYEDLDVVAPEREVKVVPVAPGALSYHEVDRVDLSDQMPPTGNQGGQGSCASWSIAYYHRTQLEFIERRWDLTDPRHQFSPGFCYNQVNGGGDRGSGFTGNFGLMVDQGCASLADAPYNDRDPISWPSESAYSRALPYRLKDWGWSWVRDSAGVAVIKQLLNNGFSSCLAMWVWGNFDNIAQYNYIYAASERAGENRGGHLITIVGYDDTLPTADGPGAFRCVNSWGPGWGQQGYFWMTYEAVKDAQLSMRQVGWGVDTVGYEPKMVGRVRIEHPDRDRVGITFLVGRRDTPLWFYDYRTWRWPGVAQPFPATTMVFDMTGGADFIGNLETDSTFVTCYDDLPDGKDGAITSYSVQYLPWANVVRSHDTPVAIPDTWEMVYALARPGQWNPDVGIVEGPSPIGVLDSGQTVTPGAKVRNFGTGAATFPVVMRIGDGYCDTAYVNGLAPADTARVSFRDWTAPGRGYFHLRCSTALDGDEYNDNDHNDDSVYARVRDAVLLEITSPPDTLDTNLLIAPQVRVRNAGTQTETIRAVFRIPAEAYMRAGQRAVEPGEDALISFPNWRSRVVGTHVALCTLSILDDMHLENNSRSKEVTVSPGAGIEEGRGRIPTAFALESGSPNPFRGSIALNCALPAAEATTLDIYDATGSLVRRLFQTRLAAGMHRVTWDGRNGSGAIAPAGVYYARLEAGASRTTTRVLKLE